MSNDHAVLIKIIDQATASIKQMAIEEMQSRPGNNKWSKKEILGHLIDSAYNNHLRFLRAGAQEDLIFDGYNQNEWVIKNNYQQRAVNNILDTWTTVNQHLGYLLEQLPEPLLSRETTKHNFHQICMRPVKEDSVTKLAYLVEDYIFHLEHHLAQIIEGYQRRVEEVKS